MFQRIISTLTALTFTVLSSVAMAADNAAIVGSWNMELDFQGQPFALDLTITETPEGLAGTITAPEFGSIPLKSVSFDGDSLKWESDDQQGGTATATMKLADSKLTGNIASAMGEIVASASRK